MQTLYKFHTGRKESTVVVIRRRDRNFRRQKNVKRAPGENQWSTTPSITQVKRSVITSTDVRYFFPLTHFHFHLFSWFSPPSSWPRILQPKWRHHFHFLTGRITARPLIMWRTAKFGSVKCNPSPPTPPFSFLTPWQKTGRQEDKSEESNLVSADVNFWSGGDEALR